MINSLTLPTASQIRANRNLSPQSSTEEINRRFAHESSKIGIAAAELLRQGQSHHTNLTINRIPSTVIANNEEGLHSIIAWPYDNQGPNGYQPEYMLFKRGGEESECTISDITTNGESTYLSRATLTEPLAKHYNREFNPERPFKPGEVVIRTVTHKPGEKLREEILSRGQYLARTMTN